MYYDICGEINMDKLIGQRLTGIRKELKLTQEQLAEILNVSVKHYGTIERGITSLSTDKLVILINILNVDVNYLLTGKRMIAISPQKIINIKEDINKLQKDINIFLSEFSTGDNSND